MVFPTSRFHILLAVAAAGLLSLAVTYGKPLNGPVIRSDGLGYYLYLPAAVIDHDLTLRRTVARSFRGVPPEGEGVNRVEGSSRLLIKYPMGEAILLAPFFLLAHASTALTGLAPPDGFSTPYQAAVALGGLTYLVLGLALLGRFLTRSFTPRIVTWTLVAITFGTNLFHYGTYDNTFSHIYAFFAVTLFLSCVEPWLENPSTGRTMSLAVSAALVTLVRPTNSLLLIFALLCGVTTMGGFVERLRTLSKRLSIVALGVVTYVAIVGLQLAYWKAITGHWIVFAYTGERFQFSQPEILNVLFSIRKGMFFWSPLLLLATAGFAVARGRARGYLLPSAVALGLSVYLISSWYDWAYGGSFGHRAFVETLPVFAIGYASLLQAVQGTRWWRPIVAASATLMALSTFLMIRYWTHVLPYDKTTWGYLVRAFTAW